MDFLDNWGTAKTRIMQGRSKHVDGFSDTSSAGSILDETDREVSRLTERAFKSLCVAEGGICNDVDIPSSPSAVSVSQTSDLPSSDKAKHSKGVLQNCNKSSKIIQKQPKELPDTFQESTVQCSVEKKDAKRGSGTGFSSETVGSSQHSAKQKSKISSLIEAFDQSDNDFPGDITASAKQASVSGHPELPGDIDNKNIAQWDASAIINLHKEKSSFSAACQEKYWTNKKQIPPGKGNKNNPLNYMKTAQYRRQGHFTDVTIPNISSKKADKGLTEIVSKVKKPDPKSNFLHSECSAFKSWHDHSKYLFEEDDHIENLTVTLQSSAHLQNLCADNTVSCRKVCSLGTVQSPNEVKAQRAVNCSPSSKDSDFHSVPSECSVKGNAKQRHSLQVAGPEKTSGGDEGKGFQLWRSSRNPRHNRQIETELVSGEVSSTECHPAADLTTHTEQPPREQSPPFSISKLLTPNIVHNANETDRSTIVVTPPGIQLPVGQGDEAKGSADYLLRENYKSKASSLLYNLKDVRKRVKSTYSNAGATQSLSEQSKNKDYIYQNIHRANERTSSAPLRLGIKDNHTGDSNEPEKQDKMPNAKNVTATSGHLGKATIIHKAETDSWKNDDYLNLRSPQTVKEARNQPSRRTRNARPRSAMITTEIHAERSLDRKCTYQPNMFNDRKETSCPPTTFQKNSALARKSPEETQAMPEKAGETQNRFHHSRNPECSSSSHRSVAGNPSENHFRKQDDKLAWQKAEDVCRPVLEANVSNNWITTHSAREEKATQDVKSPNQSYFALGDDRYQDPERMMADLMAERGNYVKRGCSNSWPAADEGKDTEKNDLQYYALSDWASNSGRKAENQSSLPEYQGHLQEKMARGLPGQRIRDSSPLEMSCEEKFYNIFSKQEVRGSTNSPRPSLFKIKDNVSKTSPATKGVRPTVPESVPEELQANTVEEAPNLFLPEGNAQGDKREICVERSAVMCSRPESACSIDSKTAGKPPVVPPKSEKAIRRAKKLTTRRKKADARQKTPSVDDAETNATVSNAPVSPPRVPIAQTPTVSSPEPTQPIDSCVIPAVSNIMALNSVQPIASVHSFPLSQRKLLQDPESGQYFFVDIPIQVQAKTLYDPETDRYFQVSIPSTGQNTSLDFFNNSYVLYPGFLSFPLTSVSSIRSPSQMSAPAILLDVQDKEKPLHEWVNTDLGRTGLQGNEPYIETLFDPHTGCRVDMEDVTWCSAMSSQLQPEGHNLDLIVMGELEDIAIENN
ncbi:cardiac-enriched FHL2-interacting protein [Stegostoma tigrinum]|uniref:cardiac-enriched FHL2-interacting protein n=1 Tax=Stegostoma tigrinum TaxID=3053191 RepID=UPI00202B013C|nr:cardiac-enriched FHL2-interacting protein [Stegostoma tigrinum]XP_048419182.1 cardiac-enriched FHL2-interacting protein [Stegostoma tigrinum]XP_048419183.1 cardiac-enriched FHL2-interacting protein [Stegostoma tigrinum]XP_048419185.1 cardiac-enriched FHL2-interacting protein [Stegostoma tigrinum]XP_048419186.1 cardiac-enriched FHL2-interacting protein [Stegostoma tigrinum]XP_059496316.1 cardiac-enriched FHL2-interacting protein [Stegostoma tigrinum]